MNKTIQDALDNGRIVFAYIRGLSQYSLKVRIIEIVDNGYLRDDHNNLFYAENVTQIEIQDELWVKAYCCID